MVAEEKLPPAEAKGSAGNPANPPAAAPAVALSGAEKGKVDAEKGSVAAPPGPARPTSRDPALDAPASAGFCGEVRARILSVSRMSNTSPDTHTHTHIYIYRAERRR